MRTIDTESRLTALVESAGLDPGHLDPWEGWKLFKAFARETVVADDESVTVQATRLKSSDGLDLVFVSMLRQFTAAEDHAQTPVWYVGLELAYESEELSLAADAELWSYDFADLTAFTSEVELQAWFQQALAVRPVETEIVSGEI